MDELIERLGKSWYISKLDLTKAFWQVPLSPSGKQKTVVVNLLHLMAGHGPSLWPPWCPHHLSAHDGHYPPRRYTATYPDYIVIHWEEHLLCLGCATGFRVGWARNQPQSVTSDNQGPEPGKSHWLEPP